MRNYNRLTFEERVKIETYFNLCWTLMRIADKLGRSKSTISREITRYPYSYAAEKAQLQADYQSRNHHFRRRLDENAQLFNVVYRYLKKHWSPQQISTYLRKKYAEKPTMQILEIPLKLTPPFRTKLTPTFRSKVTPVVRAKVTPLFC